MDGASDGGVLAGVDGCPGAWIAALEGRDGRAGLAVFPAFADLLAALHPEAIVAVDMPIGLPERILGPGRAAEQAARPLLKARQSSVFSIPARAAVEIDPGPHEGDMARSLAHRRASDLARTLSDPPRGVSRQGFMLFPKILEIDRLLRADPALASRVHESHPELAFSVLNDGEPMREPKKVRRQIHPPGMAERRVLLLSNGLSPALLAAPLPPPAHEDDRLDACAMLLVARRIRAGTARAFPDPPGRDAHGLPVTIRA